jgi:hypothetical protein
MRLTLKAFKNWGRSGGKKRAKQLTAAQRSEIARKAVRARWDKAKGKGK